LADLHSPGQADERGSSMYARDDAVDKRGVKALQRVQERGLATHILPTSATMIGVCMTVLSIGHLGPAGELRLIVDKLLAIDAIVFLISALLSFMSMRVSGHAQRHEARADLVFIGGLVVLALVAVTLAFSVT
jgi:hypothetical protein